MNDETTLNEGVSPDMDDNALASAFEGRPLSGDTVQDAPAAEPEASEESETPETDDSEDAEPNTIEYLEDYAKQNGLELSDLLGLKVKLKVDGQESDATLQDVIKINQLEGHVNRKSIELSDKQKAWETEQVQIRGEWQQKVAMAGSVIDGQERDLIQQYQGVDWNELYQSDPMQYSALQLRFQQANNEVQQKKQSLHQHYEQSLNQQRETARPKAIETIRSQHPDLNDDASYGNALGEIKGYLKSIGAPDQNYDAVELDPVVFKVARDAARYQQLMSRKPDISAKLKSAPAMQKPSPKEAIGASAQRSKALRERAGKGDNDAIASLLESL